MANELQIVSERETLTSDEAKNLAQKGALVADDRRVRSSYFDGRFLTAKDLVRDQIHFLTRQADFGRAVGSGIVAGLRVTEVKNNKDRQIEIEPGHGLTPNGEIVVLRSKIGLNLNDIPAIERLDAALGLSRVPATPAHLRSGLFILTLRPVEYTANPIASYPTSLDGGRSVHDADIIEAVAITLVPYTEKSADGTLATRRSRAAHAIFVHGARTGVREDALPIAMLGLDHGVLQWIDPFLVRREIVSEQTSILGFGRVPRALREAHLLQYDQHFADVMKLANANPTQGKRFSASEHFHALPPVGRLPKAAIDVEKGTQYFFSPEIEISLSVVPEDELGAVIDECAMLPPIDLTRGGPALEGTSVLVLVPVPRGNMDEALMDGAPIDLGALSDVWQNAIASVPRDSLWFVRRKNFSAAASVSGAVAGSEPLEPGEPGTTNATGDASGGSGAAGGTEAATYWSEIKLRYEKAGIGRLLEELVVNPTHDLSVLARARDIAVAMTKANPIILLGALGEILGPLGAVLTVRSLATIENRFEKLIPADVTNIETALIAGARDPNVLALRREGIALSFVVPELIKVIGLSDRVLPAMMLDLKQVEASERYKAEDIAKVLKEYADGGLLRS